MSDNLLYLYIGISLEFRMPSIHVIFASSVKYDVCMLTDLMKIYMAQI